jgi:hypothetical protein
MRLFGGPLLGWACSVWQPQFCRCAVFRFQSEYWRCRCGLGASVVPPVRLSYIPGSCARSPGGSFKRVLICGNLYTKTCSTPGAGASIGKTRVRDSEEMPSRYTTPQSRGAQRVVPGPVMSRNESKHARSHSLPADPRRVGTLLHISFFTAAACALS